MAEQDMPADRPGRIVILQPEERKPRTSPVPDLLSEVLFTDRDTTRSMVAGVVVLPEHGKKILFHHHTKAEELQYVLYGHGVVRNSVGDQQPVGPDTAVYCPPGPEGGHEFENTGHLPLGLLYVYSSPSSEVDVVFRETAP